MRSFSAEQRMEIQSFLGKFGVNMSLLTPSGYNDVFFSSVVACIVFNKSLVESQEIKQIYYC